MSKNKKLIIAGTAATSVSFFLPWINTWVGGIAPSKIFQMGEDAMTFGTMIFIGSFVLAAITCFMYATSKENPLLAIATGALPFFILAFAQLKADSMMTNALGANFDWSDFGQLFQVFAIGLPVYFVGSFVTLLLGFITFQAEGDPLSTAPSDLSGDVT